MNSVFFLSFDEPNAEKNWQALSERVPTAKRIHGVSGIVNGHRRCAELAQSEMFFLVDGDNEVLPHFLFDYKADPKDQQSIHVWRCQNAVNGLIYGYGAIKLYPKQALTSPTVVTVDLATSASRSYITMPGLASITHFNTSPLNAWRSAFRECVKLASGVIANHKPMETYDRLNTWCTVGADKPYGEWCIRGAQEGRKFGTENRDNISALAQINDFKWLRARFENS